MLGELRFFPKWKEAAGVSLTLETSADAESRKITERELLQLQAQRLQQVLQHPSEQRPWELLQLQVQKHL